MTRYYEAKIVVVIEGDDPEAAVIAFEDTMDRTTGFRWSWDEFGGPFEVDEDGELI